MAAPGKKPPAFQFYAGDWLRDPGVQNLTLEERGAWIQCLCFMHLAEPRGRMAVNGRDLSDEEIADLMRIDSRRWQTIRSKLEANGVAKRWQKTGGLYSGRMVAESLQHKAKVEAGKAGAKARWNGKRIADPKANSKQKRIAKMAPSSSSSERNKKERMAELEEKEAKMDRAKQDQKAIVNRLLKDAQPEPDDLPDL